MVRPRLMAGTVRRGLPMMLMAMVLAFAATVAIGRAPAATAATCGPVCQLFVGSAHLAADPRFAPPPEMKAHAETSTVFFAGQLRMYYRTFKYANAGSDCPFPTGIALATSADGNTWKAYNSGLPLPGLTTVPACPASGSSASTWIYAPDAVADGAKLRMAFEVRQTATDGGRNINRVDVASSDDGIHWGSRRTILSPGGTTSWNAEVGTPDLLWQGSSWAVLFHANQHSQPARPGRFVRALARGGANFTDPFVVAGAVLEPQSPQQYPTESWFDYGPGLGDIVSENGVYYQVFEGFNTVPDCRKPESTPRVGLARSTDLVHWEVSKVSPFQEISQDASSCGHDMPNWQRLAIGEQTIVTTNDPPEAAAPVRWRIEAGPPAAIPQAPPDRLGPNQFLGAGQRLSTTNGYALVMQGDGNLVLVSPDGRAMWASGTDGRPGAIAAMQSDGNLVVIGPGNQPLWSTGTGGHPGAVLVLQTDANLVVYGPGNVALWASNTRTS